MFAGAEGEHLDVGLGKPGNLGGFLGGKIFGKTKPEDLEFLPRQTLSRLLPKIFDPFLDFDLTRGGRFVARGLGRQFLPLFRGSEMIERRAARDGEEPVCDGTLGIETMQAESEVPESPLARLSPREHDILRGIARGASNKVIARELGIAETTVKIHVQHVLRKLDVTSRVQAAVIATERGLT
jgi:DNA-binding CsgD family transcriptional regulator